MNLADLLSESAGRHPDKKALVVPGQPDRPSVSYRQLEAEVAEYRRMASAIGLLLDKE